MINVLNLGRLNFMAYLPCHLVLSRTTLFGSFDPTRIKLPPRTPTLPCGNWTRSRLLSSPTPLTGGAQESSDRLWLRMSTASSVHHVPVFSWTPESLQCLFPVGKKFRGMLDRREKATHFVFVTYPDSPVKQIVCLYTTQGNEHSRG